MARSDAVRGPRFVPVEVAGRRILLARLPDGRVAAFDAACPHQGQPLTGGDLEGGSVVCPHHRYAYDATSGANTAPGGDPDVALTIHSVEERGGWIFVRLRARGGA